jgi:hypothetical protein
MRSALLRESFQFLANGIPIESSVAEAAALFPAVREQLSLDSCAQKFVLKDSGIKSADIRSLQLLLSCESISNVRSQLLQRNQFGKVNEERQFLGCSESDIRKNLSDLESLDVSVHLVEALDSVLLS